MMCNGPGPDASEETPSPMLASWSPQKEALNADTSSRTGDFSLSQNGPSTTCFETGQRNAIEQLVVLKNELREASSEVFWGRLMKGITSICNAQYAFIASKHTESDVSSTDMDTRHGFNVFFDGVQTVRGECDLLQKILRGRITTDKIYVVPERLGSVVGDDGDECIPFEACLAVPLYSAGKNFAHFGLLWTLNGLSSRDVSWAYLEMILHSFEDLILLRMVEGKDRKTCANFHRTQPRREDQQQKQRQSSSQYPAPYNPPIGSSSFQPYARSLSHELRTPMQGVVGMLDVMHATVQETIENKPDPQILSLFREFRENIEAVQDSARRAIEAADNVVHAYDLNMQVPDTPEVSREEDSMTGSFRSVNGSIDNRTNVLIEGSNISVNPYKRRRTAPHDWSYPPSPKQRSVKAPRRGSSVDREDSPRTAEVKSVVEESDKIVHATPQRQMEQVLADAVGQNLDGSGRPMDRPPPIFPPLVLQYTKIRELLRLVINESLHVGGRPDSAVAESTPLGERIEVRSRSSDGRVSTKIINWSVDSSVPESLFFDEKDLAKLISCVFLNALKFTEAGSICIRTTLSHKGRYVRISVCDTGTGIPATFLPNLFKAFAREDGSTTRSKEGLGLGLLVAKGLSRRLGGDLTCVRSSTSEPDRGSEFEIRLPMNPNDCVSRPGTPAIETPAPSQVSHPSPDSNTSSDPMTEQSRTVSATETAPSPSISPSQPKLECAEHVNRTAGNPHQVEVDLPEVTRRLSVTSRSTSFLSNQGFDRNLARKLPLTFLVAEDNMINRKILVNMLGKLGYKDVYEAFNGREAVRIVSEILDSNSDIPMDMTLDDGVHMDVDTGAKTSEPGGHKFVDVVLMDLWMPDMDGYEAAERIFDMVSEHRARIARQDPNARLPPSPTVLAVTADVTDDAFEKAKQTGMKGRVMKPYKLNELAEHIVKYCDTREKCAM